MQGAVLNFTLLSHLITFEKMSKPCFKTLHSYSERSLSGCIIPISFSISFPSSLLFLNICLSLFKLFLIKHIPSHGLKYHLHSDVYQIHVSIHSASNANQAFVLVKETINGLIHKYIKKTITFQMVI